MTITVNELEQDFERLTETSMLWQAKDWLKQEGRFDGSVAFHHRVIYFFERYVDLMAAKAILKELNEDYSVLYDNALDQWVITSTYATESWR
jgi:hypothetical protein